jgi:hypothetical protein
MPKRLRELAPTILFHPFDPIEQPAARLGGLAGISSNATTSRLRLQASSVTTGTTRVLASECVEAITEPTQTLVRKHQPTAVFGLEDAVDVPTQPLVA